MFHDDLALSLYQKAPLNRPSNRLYYLMTYSCGVQPYKGDAAVKLRFMTHNLLPPDYYGILVSTYGAALPQILCMHPYMCCIYGRNTRARARVHLEPKVVQADSA